MHMHSILHDIHIHALCIASGLCVDVVPICHSWNTCTPTRLLWPAYTYIGVGIFLVNFNQVCQSCYNIIIIFY